MTKSMHARKNGQLVKLVLLASVCVLATPLSEPAHAAAPKQQSGKKMRASAKSKNSPRAIAKNTAGAAQGNAKSSRSIPQCTAADNGGIKGKWCEHLHSCIPEPGKCPGEEEVIDEAGEFEPAPVAGNDNKPQPVAARLSVALPVPEIDAGLARKLENGDSVQVSDVFAASARAVAATPSRSEVANAVLPTPQRKATY